MKDIQFNLKGTDGPSETKKAKTNNEQVKHPKNVAL